MVARIKKKKNKKNSWELVAGRGAGAGYIQAHHRCRRDWENLTVENGLPRFLQKTEG